MAQPTTSTALIHRHLVFGWASLLFFIAWGLGLEALHAFKSESYLGVEQEVRRLMWTLGHAHGVGLSLLHMGFVATVRAAELPPSARLSTVSRLLCWATLLLPGGFLGGGIVTYEGDPGLLILLAPIGALTLLFAVVQMLLSLRRS